MPKAIVFVFLITAAQLVAQSSPSWTLGADVTLEGNQAIFGKGRSATIQIPIKPNSDQLLAWNLDASQGRVLLTIHSDDTAKGRWLIKKDARGESLDAQMQVLNPESNWEDSGFPTTLTFRPRDSATLAWRHLPFSPDDAEPIRWHERTLELRIVSRGEQIECYLEGVLLGTWIGNDEASDYLTIEAEAGDAVRMAAANPLSEDAIFTPLVSKFFRTPNPTSTPDPDKLIEVDEIPFLVSENDAAVDLRQAEWPMASEHPSNYFSDYDSGPMFLHDPRNPTFWAPVQDYTYVHLLMEPTEDDGEQFTRDFSARIGTFGHGSTGGRLPVALFDLHASAPESGSAQVVSIPVTDLIAQDLRTPFQIAINKTLRLARRSPDPSRFDYRPLGLPVGAKLLGATLQESPLQIRIDPEAVGSVFTGTKKARFTAKLRNISDAPISGTILTKLGRTKSQSPAPAPIKFSVAPRSSETVQIEIPAEKWGYFPVRFTIESDSLPHPMTRQTRFALLPPDTREHFANSPFGTWTFGGGHMSCPDPEILGTLLRQAGLRFGMSRFPEARAKFGITNNFEAKKIDSPEKFREWQKENPDALPVALLMHEDAISSDHVRRIPDIFTDHPPYRLSDDEMARFEKLRDAQMESARIMRTHFPEIHLRLGNGALPTKEEFLRQGFPAELFDSLGNEAGGFGRLPEAQPPDWVGNNASLWMDHELLKAYGYDDKSVTQCYEITYPSTNPGNLTPEDQAAYFVRHALHSAAWGVPEIRFGLLDDVANAYRFSNWGASGLMTAWPHLTPKPAFVAVATMTRELDGATYQSDIPTGSPSTYALHFQKPNGQPLVILWTLRGERTAAVDVSGNDWKLTDWEGNTTSLKPNNGSLELPTSSMPVYLSGNGMIKRISLEAPSYSAEPTEDSKVISPLNDLESWLPVTTRNPILESHNPMRPRRWSEMTFAIEDSANHGPHLRVTGPAPSSPSVLPFYQALQSTNPIPLPGKPSEIGVWIDGNSGWGRVIFELKDASGQTWTSIGASRTKEISQWMLDWLPKEFAQSSDSPATQADWNTNDVFGLSAICFDGWRYVRFPLPGNYPGEGNPWPANSLWRHDGDGQVHYPLTLVRLVIELPENVLRLTELTPAHQSIGLKDLTVEYGTQGGTKSDFYETEF